MADGREDPGRTIDADRVGQLRCRPGEQVRMELGFRWTTEPRAASASFRRFVGSRYSARNLGRHIALEGNEFGRFVEAEEAYTSVILEGVVPGSIDPGVYDCRHVHFLVPGRGGSVAMVECKAGRTVSPAMAAPMLRLAAALKQSRAQGTKVELFLVHQPPRAGSPTEAVASGVRAMPWMKFVEEL